MAVIQSVLAVNFADRLSRGRFRPGVPQPRHLNTLIMFIVDRCRARTMDKGSSIELAAMHSADRCRQRIVEFEEKAEKTTSAYARHAFLLLAKRWRDVLARLEPEKPVNSG